MHIHSHTQVSLDVQRNMKCVYLGMKHACSKLLSPTRRRRAKLSIPAALAHPVPRAQRRRHHDPGPGSLCSLWKRAPRPYVLAAALKDGETREDVGWLSHTAL